MTTASEMQRVRALFKDTGEIKSVAILRFTPSRQSTIGEIIPGKPILDLPDSYSVTQSEQPHPDYDVVVQRVW